MKIGGIELKAPSVTGPLVLKRGEEFIAFWFQPVLAMDEFDALCPEPNPREFGRLTPQGWEPDPEDQGYLQQLAEYKARRWQYIVLKTLAVNDIEWDGVKLSDPRTWHLVETELRAALGVFEFSKLINEVQAANLLDSKVLERNKESFFMQGRSGSKGSIAGQKDEAGSLQSSAPANGSVSDPPG